MRDEEASGTAAWVASWRGLGAALPPAGRLADDPYGLRFATGAMALAGRWPRVAAAVGRPVLLYMQVRTRSIDDAVRAWCAEGGRQVVLLGAGFDCRALRLAELGARWFEVDHPATQARKRSLLPESPATHLPWDFEARPLADLPAALAAAGHDPQAPTLTVWEGVTMYLSEPAIGASVDAVRAWSAPGSALLVTYHDRDAVSRPGLVRRAVGAVVARWGEPFRFGWDPVAFPGWVEAHGFGVAWDRDVRDLAAALLPADLAPWVGVRGHHIALLRR